MLGISLALAVSFAGYGLVRKFTPVGSLPGLTVETSVLLLPAVAIVWWQTAGLADSSLGASRGQDALIAAAGADAALLAAAALFGDRRA